MGWSGKAKNDQGWGLGLFLVFFFDDHDQHHHHEDHSNNIKKKKQNLLSSSFKSTTSSPGTAPTSSPGSIFNNNRLLISKAQSTISICALIFFFTLLLFTLSTFEPSINNSSSSSFSTSSKIQISNHFSRKWLPDKTHNHIIKKSSSSSSSSSSGNNFALQGMGTLFRRGTKAMNDLIVAHLNEDTTDDELQLFLRTLHRSSITSRSDVVFIFPSSGFSSFSTIIQQENDSFLKLLQHHRTNSTDSIAMKKNTKIMNDFDVTHFSKSGNKSSDTLWGKSRTHDDELNEFNFGSVVGFEAAELDPEASLSGFFNDPPPIRLRRWACYPMLLGRLRRNFKHIMLIDVKDVVLLGDSLSRVRNRNAESVYLWASKIQTHNKKDQSKQPVTADVIMGGMRGVRRLSNAMLNEIVRATMKHHKNKMNSVSDTAILSQLAHNDSLLKNIDVGVTITESSIPDTSELVHARRNSSLKSHDHLVVVNRGGNYRNNQDLKSILIKEICSSTLHSSSVYRDC